MFPRYIISDFKMALPCQYVSTDKNTDNLAVFSIKSLSEAGRTKTNA